MWFLDCYHLHSYLYLHLGLEHNSNHHLVYNIHYHIIYKSSNRNKVHDKFGIMYFENRITMQIRSRD